MLRRGGEKAGERGARHLRQAAGLPHRGHAQGRLQQVGPRWLSGAWHSHPRRRHPHRAHVPRACGSRRRAGRRRRAEVRVQGQFHCVPDRGKWHRRPSDGQLEQRGLQIHKGAAADFEDPRSRRQVRFAARPEGDLGDHVPARGYAVHAFRYHARHYHEPACHSFPNDDRPLGRTVDGQGRRLGRVPRRRHALHPRHGEGHFWQVARHGFPAVWERARL
mmetsp:Transcript_55085/g.167394  ORF Transcript_55085/g.167394 Transcript_55085/m.167394 type:complete len:219 (+) Transcript_55085:2499-3155(+)